MRKILIRIATKLLKHAGADTDYFAPVLLTRLRELEEYDWQRIFRIQNLKGEPFCDWQLRVGNDSGFGDWLEKHSTDF